MACQSSCNQAVCRSAIAINNIGWSLLERGCYDQAHVTLKDAALAMISLIHDTEEETRQLVGASLLAANRRLAFPCRSAASLAPLEREDCPEPVRLDVDDLVVVDAPLDFVAIAVHNSAVSYFYQAIAAADSPDEKHVLQSRAVSLLRLSYSIISDVEGYAPTTLSHGLHILESLHKVMRFPMPSDVVPTAQGSAAAGDIHTSATLDVDAELTQLRAMVHSLEAVNIAMFGSTVFAAAA